MTDLARRLRAEGLAPGSWSNGPHDRYSGHVHDFDKVLVCEAGAIAFGLPASGTRIDLAPGDRLELPAGTEHDASVGRSGVTCLEAHLPAGRLDGLRHRRAGSW